MNILYASTNLDKIKDIKKGVKLLGIDAKIVGLKEIDLDIEVEETEVTLLENARKKAKTVFEIIKKQNAYDLVIAEDFGFFVEAFKEVAGIYAKRWKEGNNLDRAKAIVELFKKTGETNKKATFSCAMVAYSKLGKEFSVVKHLTGEIGERIPKENGFGYHQIVIMPDGRYLNDYTLEEKFLIWPRQLALAEILHNLKK